MSAALGIILTSISMLALGWLVWTQVQKQESKSDQGNGPDDQETS